MSQLGIHTGVSLQVTACLSGQKVKVTENVNVKIVFHAYRRKKWINFHQTKTKVMVSLSYTHCQIHC